MYVPPIHVDLVHFMGTMGAPVPYLHVDQDMSTYSTYKLYTKFHQA